MIDNILGLNQELCRQIEGEALGRFLAASQACMRPRRREAPLEEEEEEEEEEDHG